MTPEDRKALRAAIIGSGETRRDHYEIAESIEAAGFIRAGTAGVTLWRAALSPTGAASEGERT